VLILLPPSEGKNEPYGRARPVDLTALSFPELSATREKVLRAAIETCTLPDAPRRFQVGPSVAGEVLRNALIEELPARPAMEIYSGVLYKALDWASLSPAAKRRAASRLIIVSGLWGALRPGDRIPPYRLHVCSQLVGMGFLEPLWRSVLPSVLAKAAGRRGVIVDCRSSSYTAVGMPEDLTDRAILMRIVREGGAKAAPSFHAKQTRGHLTRYLLEAGANPTSPHGLAKVLRGRWDVTLDPPKRDDKPWIANVVAQT
jgi:hypothetical protein